MKNSEFGVKLRISDLIGTLISNIVCVILILCRFLMGNF